VLSLWSLVLSFKGLYHNERTKPLVVNIVWVLVEITIPCLYPWWPLIINYRSGNPIMDMALELFLPFIVPFLTLTTALTAPVALYWTRRRERKAVLKGETGWTRRRRWAFGLRRWAALEGVLFLTLGIPLVYGFSLLVMALPGRVQVPAGPRIIAGVMPDFVKVGFDRLFERIGPKMYSIRVAAFYRDFPNGRLVEIIQKEDVAIFYSALSALAQKDRALAILEFEHLLFARSDPERSAPGVQWLKHFAPETYEQVWPRLVSHPETTVRAPAACAYQYHNDPGMMRRYSEPFLQDKEDLVVAAALSNFNKWSYPPHREVKLWVHAVMPLLDHAEMYKSRLATYYLARVVGIRVRATETASNNALTRSLALSPAEIAERDLLRKKISEWLEKDP